MSERLVKQNTRGNVTEFDRITRRKHVADIMDTLGEFCTIAKVQSYVEGKMGYPMSHMTIARDVDSVKRDKVMASVEIGGTSPVEVFRRFDTLFSCLLDILNDKGIDADKRVNAGKAAAGVLKNRCEVVDMLSKINVAGSGVSATPDASVKPVDFSGFSDEVVSIPDNPTSVKPISSRGVPSFGDKHGHSDTRYGHRSVVSDVVADGVPEPPDSPDSPDSPDIPDRPWPDDEPDDEEKKDVVV